MNKQKLLKIAIPVLILAVIAGIWAIKNKPAEPLIGHGILAVIAGTSIGFVQKLSQSEKYGKTSVILKIIMGGLILLIGFYLFYLGF